MKSNTFTLREIFLDAREDEFCGYASEIPAPSVAYQKRIKKIVSRKNTYSLPIFNTVVKRIAVLLIVLGMICSMPLVSSAVRQAVGGFFAEMFETFTRYEVDNTGTEMNNRIEVEYEIELPEGFLEFERSVYRRSISIRYRNSENEEIVFSQTANPNFTTNHDAENVTVEEIIIDDFIALYFEGKQYRDIMWTQDGYTFVIRVPESVSKEFLINMARSCAPAS